MKHKLLAIISIVISITALLISSYLYTNKKATVIVKLDEVLKEYLGSKEAMKKYDIKLKTWEQEVDSLTLSYQKNFDLYNHQVNDLPEDQQRYREELLGTQYSNLQTISKQFEQRAYQEKQTIQYKSMTNIKKYLKEYSLKHGYDVVIGDFKGNTVVLYTSEPVDVTESFIIALNNNYLGGDED